MDDSFKLQFHLLDGKGRPCGVFDDAILRYIKDNYNLFFLAGTPYHYTDGVYRTDFSGARLKTLIKSLLYTRFIKSTTLTRVYQLFAMDYEKSISTRNTGYHLRIVCWMQKQERCIGTGRNTAASIKYHGIMSLIRNILALRQRNFLNLPCQQRTGKQYFNI